MNRIKQLPRWQQFAAITVVLFACCCAAGIVGSLFSKDDVSPTPTRQSRAIEIEPTPAPTFTDTPQPTATPPPTNTPVSAETPTPTTQLTPGPANLVIATVNKGDEYVDIRNTGGTDQDLTGWVLLSEKGDQACPLAGILQAGQTLRIWARAEDSDKEGFNCGFEDNIWNNDESDPAVLLNADGQEVDRR